ncbi:Formin-like protein [Actinidia chinensis var. chinensis]|uniref:Formin-like protein n=1 Tax=Actinidia chinensis var. chinensis TaxID=1590841 RepID=A0A2R6PW07_ACTCC|nr:Formin-like protein [Actinidia chinensis var. chinensis]
MRPPPPLSPRRIFTPGALRKRKEMEAPAPLYTAEATTPYKEAKPDSCNQLLAGYMAHEFLTKGTLLGQKWDPARAEAVPVSKPSPSKRAEAEPSRIAKKPHCDERYGDVVRLLKEDGAHMPGIVNPTQVARWIQM